MAVRATGTRTFKMEKLSVFLGNMTVVKIVQTVKKGTGEVTNTITILSDLQADVFDIVLPFAPDEATYPIGTKVDFVNVEYTIRANGRQFGQWTMGEISDEIKAENIIKAGSQPTSTQHSAPTPGANK